MSKSTGSAVKPTDPNAAPVRLATERFSADDGHPLTVAVGGDGPAIVFLHGWISNRREWLPYGAALAAEFRCLCWDARGHGLDAAPPRQPVTVRRMAHDLRDLIRHFSLRQPLLVGHSMGALTAWEYIREFGCRTLGGLALIDQSPRLLTGDDWRYGIYGDFCTQRNQEFISRCQEDFAETVLKLIANSNNRKAREAYATNLPEIQQTRSYLQQLAPEPLIEIWRSLASQDYRATLPDIDIPTLLIHGDESHFYHLGVARYLSEQIPQAKLKVYAGADHSPHLGEREQFIADLETFAREILPPMEKATT